MISALIGVAGVVSNPTAWAQDAPQRAGTASPSATKATRITPDQVVAEVRIDQKLNNQVPLDLPFKDGRGRDVTMRGLLRPGKPAVFVMVQLNCPMMCGMMLEGVTSALRELKFSPSNEFDVIVASIDPSETARDAMLEKQEYVEVYGRRGTEHGWHFLVGSEANVRALADSVGFRYKHDPVTGAYVHASGIMILTPEGKVARYFMGISYPAKVIRLSLVEAAQGKIGTLVDKMNLFCYQYDPIEGKYGLVISRVTQVMGVATALILGTYMLVMFRRDRNRRIVAAAVARPIPSDV
jgi:protein SCO1/2